MILPVLLFAVFPKGNAKQQNLATLQVDRITRSPPSLMEQDEEEEEEGQVTPLPGSTVELDTLAWPPDEDTQGPVHMTVIPLERVSVFILQGGIAHYTLYDPETNCLKIVSSLSDRSFTRCFFDQFVGTCNIWLLR